MEVFKRLFTSPQIDGQRQYYFWVDLLRGLAAVIMLFWHYNHLYYPEADSNPIIHSNDIQPLYSFFRLFYDHGHWAVQLFWVISGFVLASVYIDTRSTTKDFFVNRFARLYPLHFLTLVAVSLLQLWSVLLTGHFQIYPGQDLHNLGLNLLFISGWGFEHGLGFNAPIWSVSVEIFIYIVFWVLLRRVFRFGVVLPLLLAAGFLEMEINGARHLFWQCGCYFFLGTAVFIILHAFKKQNLVSLAAGAAGTIAGCALFVNMPGHWAFALLLFPSLVLLAGAVDNLDSGIGKAFKPFSDLSYGIYLWHIPVQILIILSLDSIGLDRQRLVSSGFFLVFFIAAVLAAAKLSFEYYENPARALLKNRGRAALPGRISPGKVEG